MASIVTGSQSGGEGAAAVPPEWASEIALSVRIAACDVTDSANAPEEQSDRWPVSTGKKDSRTGGGSDEDDLVV
jgi:hypothetical protein